MRISANELFRHSHQISQRRIADLQQQISSGKKILSPSDDPVVAAQAVKLKQAVVATEQHQENTDFVMHRLNMEEVALKSTTDVLHRVRELAVQGNNPILGQADRRIIAQEIRQRLDELVALGNSSDGNGEYLFAGFQRRTQPFTANANEQVVYNGDQGVRNIKIGSEQVITDGDTGAAVFMAIRNGNSTFSTELGVNNTGTGSIEASALVAPNSHQARTFRIVFTGDNTFDVVDHSQSPSAKVLEDQAYVAGGNIEFNGMQITLTGEPKQNDEFIVKPSENQSVFATLQQLANTLEGARTTPTQQTRYAHAIARALEDIDQAEGRISQVRSSVGVRLNSVENQKSANDGILFELKTMLSTKEDVDMVEAISQLTQETTALQAAQQTFVRTQNLSLFNYL